MKKLVLFIIMFTTIYAQQLVYENDQFRLYDIGVKQGKYQAAAISATEIQSSYAADFATGVDPVLTFKFSINGKDNERPPYQDHRFVLDGNGRFTTPVYTFGEAHKQDQQQTAKTDRIDAAQVTFQVDMRHVLQSLKNKGYYECVDGSRISAKEFKGVFIAGGTAPLKWAWDDPASLSELQLTDADKDGIYNITLNFTAASGRPIQKGKAVWKLSKDISHLPQYHSEQMLVDALYNLSLEEAEQLLRADGMFNTGAEWDGVWTRDLSYSAYLALAITHPEAVKKSLLYKVRNNRIVQDTGTGGSWPVSTDRMVWAVAAWEVFKVTGDVKWLIEFSTPFVQSLQADQLSIVSPENLMFGESSFLDWREQTYPRWMEPKDIFLSQTLGTSAVHYQALNIMSYIADLSGAEAESLHAKAQTLKTSINDNLWMPQGYYSQYLYGRNFFAQSPRAEALGEALTVIFGIANAERAAHLIANMPLTPFGATCIYPQIPDVPPYHNNAVWPFVQAYWNWAAAMTKNNAAVEHGLACLYRAGALFLTNKENMVAENGHFNGTQINSDRQLWSVAGNLAMVYRVFFGMKFTPTHLFFDPFVPASYPGTKRLTNLHYQKAILDITLKGTGSKIQSIKLDGKSMDKPLISGSLTGKHQVEITLVDDVLNGTINMKPVRFSPKTPIAIWNNEKIYWKAVPGAMNYHIYLNGRKLSKTTETAYKPAHNITFGEFQILAEDANGLQSFLSEPVRVGSSAAMMFVKSDQGAVIETTPLKNSTISFQLDIKNTGLYALDFVYANNNGPINTDNKCAIRTLYVDSKRQGIVVMPQRGESADNFGYTNPVQAELEAGAHNIQMIYEPENRNMNETVNNAAIKHMRVTRLD